MLFFIRNGSFICPSLPRVKNKVSSCLRMNHIHKGAFCQFPFLWIYYCHSSKSTGKQTGETHLYAHGYKRGLSQTMFTRLDVMKRTLKLSIYLLKGSTLQIHTAERQWKCSETTVKKYSGLPQIMLHCIFYQ